MLRRLLSTGKLVRRFFGRLSHLEEAARRYGCRWVKKLFSWLSHHASCGPFDLPLLSLGTHRRPFMLWLHLPDRSPRSQTGQQSACPYFVYQQKSALSWLMGLVAGDSFLELVDQANE